VVLDVPLERTEPTHEEQNHAHAEVREDDTHPNLRRQRLQERKHARLLFCRLLINSNSNSSSISRWSRSNLDSRLTGLFTVTYLYSHCMTLTLMPCLRTVRALVMVRRHVTAHLKLSDLLLYYILLLARDARQALPHCMVLPPGDGCTTTAAVSAVRVNDANIDS